MLITKSYAALNRSLHSKGSYGRNGDKWASRVSELVDRLQPSSILDYGCGQGALGRALGHAVSEYDPAIPGKDEPPQPADLVICTDVLEHVEPECLQSVLDHLRDLTTGALFAVISTRPAKKFLEDGRNAHLIVRSWGFWEAELASRFKLTSPVINHKEFEILLLRA